MSDIRSSVQEILSQFVETHDQSHAPIDVLRVIEQEAMLMKETEAVREALDMDPMEQFEDCQKEIQRFKQLLQVSSCTRLRASDDYCLIQATVDLKKCENLQLHFRYERTRQREAPDGCHIWYSIELNRNFGQKENLLAVQLFCPKIVPCTTKTAECLNDKMEGSDDEDEGGWEDISESEAIDIEQKSSLSSPEAKKQKLNGDEEETKENHDIEDGDDEADKFLVFMDPEVLETFLESTKLKSLNEATAFFLLMTLPFYEHEWDIVGYVLDTVFGGGEEESEESDEDE